MASNLINATNNKGNSLIVENTGIPESPNIEFYNEGSLAYGMLTVYGGDYGYYLVTYTADEYYPFYFDDAGSMNRLHQTTFSAHFWHPQSNVTGDGTNYQLPCSDINLGGAWYSAGTFTATVSGRFLFTVMPKYFDATSSHTYMIHQIVTSNRTYTLGKCNPYAYSTSGVIQPHNPVVFVDMDASDTATFHVTISGGTKVIDTSDGYYLTDFGCFVMGTLIC